MRIDIKNRIKQITEIVHKIPANENWNIKGTLSSVRAINAFYYPSEYKRIEESKLICEFIILFPNDKPLSEYKILYSNYKNSGNIGKKFNVRDRLNKLLDNLIEVKVYD